MGGEGGWRGFGDGPRTRAVMARNLESFCQVYCSRSKMLFAQLINSSCAASFLARTLPHYAAHAARLIHDNTAQSEMVYFLFLTWRIGLIYPTKSRWWSSGRYRFAEITIECIRRCWLSSSTMVIMPLHTSHFTARCQAPARAAGHAAAPHPASFPSTFTMSTGPCA